MKQSTRTNGQLLFSCSYSNDVLLRNVFQMIFILQLCIHIAYTFNLDTRIPVYKFGPKDSYFGYSVAEHVTINHDRRTEEPIILVGAPKALSKFDQIRTGAVYKCPLNTKTDDCVNLYVDPDNSTYLENADKEDQWLGVTVKSQGKGGYVMVCAHRYVHKGSNFRWGNGICYSLTQFLDYSRTYEPCRNRLVDLAHEQFGYCQAGTSGEISKDLEILIGSPGPYTWRGTVFANNIRHSIKDDKTWYMGPVIEGQSPVSKYSYLGMSVSSGDFFDNKLTIAGGAPRSNGTGQVIFYNKDLGKNLFDLKGILQGEQFASSFGYSMTTLDCDGDGHADLAVGAPFYYTRTEGGAVYVYISKNLRHSQFKTDLKLTGKPESRFGFSLANASDLNKDGFEDLAVGAPYEKNGVVYIYLGSPSGLKTEPSQIIEPAMLPYPLDTIKTFGYSLSGNVDLDQNSYPDLLVGAYESDAVVLLRSRPIIKIKTSVKGNLTQIDPNSKGCVDDPTSSMACFSVQPCFRFLTHSLSSMSGNSLKYRIEAETFTGNKYYRVIFRSSKNLDTPNIVEKTVLLNYGYNHEYCTKEIIYLKANQDIQNSIPFKLTYSLKQNVPQLPRKGAPLHDINDYPILDQEEAQRIFYARFNKECGNDDICDSNLVVSAQLAKARRKEGNNYTLVLTDDNINLNIQVMNSGESAYDPSVIIEHSSSLSFVSKKSSETDQIDCSPEGKNRTRCSLSNPFNKGKVNFTIRFSGHNIPFYQRDIFIKVTANTTSNDLSAGGNTVSFDTEILRKVELELSGISQEQQVRFGGEVKGETAMYYEDEIGNRVYHKYIVKNHGPLPARDVVVSVHWPIQLENGREFGKWLLYITAKPTILGQSGYCKLESRYINPKNFMAVQDASEKYQSIKERKKRAVNLIREERDKDGNSQNVVSLSCDKGAKCIKFECLIQNIQINKTAVIRIPSRLWNATFVEEFSNVHHVSIKSFAKINLNSLFNIIQNDKDDMFTVETMAFPDTAHLAPQASWWWYLLGILFGLIILTFIIVLLYKTGFFKREKGYSQVHQNENDTN